MNGVNGYYCNVVLTLQEYENDINEWVILSYITRVTKRYHQYSTSTVATLFQVNGFAYTEVDASLGFGLRFIGVVDQCFFVPVEDKPPLVPG